MQKCLQFIKQNILLCGFLALVLLPYPLWALLHGFVDITNYENRTYASLPTLATTSLAEFPAAFELWIEDNAPFRNQFMQLNATLNWQLDTLDSTDVLLGKEDWLFLKDSHDSSSLSDYQGLTSYTDTEQAEILTALQTLSTQLAAYDCQLVVLFAPAKEGVYAQYMPDSIVVTGDTRVETLAAYLTDEMAQDDNFALVWPRDALQELATRQDVYYKYDTHWNEVGGWLASQLVLKALEMDYNPDDPNVLIDTTTAAPNDLADTSATWAICTDDIFYALDEPSADYTWIGEEGYMTQLAGSGTQNLLLIRDSFGDAMAPYLAEGFAATDILHGNILKTEMLMVYDVTMPDVVVIEVGERFSDNLLSRTKTLIELLPILAR